MPLTKNAFGAFRAHRPLLAVAGIVLFVLGFRVDGLLAQPTAGKQTLWEPDAKGRPKLRGANIWQKAVFKDPPRASQLSEMETNYSGANIKKLSATWKANYVNISHPGILHPAERDAKQEYAFVPEIAANLDRLVALAAENGLFVVISFRTGPGRTEETFLGESECPTIRQYLFDVNPNTGALEDRAKKAHAGWIKMWRLTAERYKDKPNVVGYDLMVEPLTVWESAPRVFAKLPGEPARIAKRSEEELKTAQRKHWHNLAKQLAEAVRAIDKTTPILVGPAPYNAVAGLKDFEATAMELQKNWGPTVVAVHQYDPWEYTGQQRDENKRLPEPRAFGKVEQGDLKDRYETIAEFKKDTHMRVAVNEYGVTRWAGKPHQVDADSFLHAQLERLESLGLNHALWLWEVDRIDYTAMHFRLGINRRNKLYDAGEDDPLVDLIKSNWRQNEVYAPVEVAPKGRK